MENFVTKLMAIQAYIQENESTQNLIKTMAVLIQRTSQAYTPQCEKQVSSDFIEACIFYTHCIFAYHNRDESESTSDLIDFLRVLYYVFKIKEITPPVLKAVVLEVIDTILDPSSIFSTSYEIVKYMNAILMTCDKDCKRHLTSIENFYFMKLMDHVLVSGDFDMQSAIVELLFYLCPTINDKKVVEDFFPSNVSLQQALTNIRKDHFDHDVRYFLNVVNTFARTVVSIRADVAFAGTIKIIPPVQFCTETNQDLWIDFNTLSKCISIQCAASCLSKSIGIDEDLIDVLIIKQRMVDTICLKNSRSKTKPSMLIIKLKGPPKVILDSSVELIAKCRHIEVTVSVGLNDVEDVLHKMFPEIFQQVDSNSETFHLPLSFKTRLTKNSVKSNVPSLRSAKSFQKELLPTAESESSLRNKSSSSESAIFETCRDQSKSSEEQILSVYRDLVGDPTCNLIEETDRVLQSTLDAWQRDECSDRDVEVVSNLQRIQTTVNNVRLHEEAQQPVQKKEGYKVKPAKKSVMKKTSTLGSISEEEESSFMPVNTYYPSMSLLGKTEKDQSISSVTSSEGRVFIGKDLDDDSSQSDMFKDIQYDVRVGKEILGVNCSLDVLYDTAEDDKLDNVWIGKSLIVSEALISYATSTPRRNSLVTSNLDESDLISPVLGRKKPLELKGPNAKSKNKTAEMSLVNKNMIGEALETINEIEEVVHKGKDRIFVNKTSQSDKNVPKLLKNKTVTAINNNSLITEDIFVIDSSDEESFSNTAVPKNKILKSVEKRIKDKPKTNNKLLKTSEVDDLTNVEDVTSKNKVNSSIENVVLSDNQTKNETIKSTKEPGNTKMKSNTAKPMTYKLVENRVEISSKDKPKSKNKSSKTSEVYEIEIHDTKSTNETVHIKTTSTASNSKNKIHKSAENGVEISSKGKPKPSKTSETSETLESYDDLTESDTVTSKNKIPSATEQGVHDLVNNSFTEQDWIEIDLQSPKNIITKSTKETVHIKTTSTASDSKNKIHKSAENGAEISSKGKPKPSKTSETLESYDDLTESNTVTSKNKIPSATEHGVYVLVDIEDTTFENNKIKSTKDTVNTKTMLSATDSKSKIPKSAENGVETSSKGKPKSKKKSSKTFEVEVIEAHDDHIEIDTVTSKNKIPSATEQGVHDLIDIEDTMFENNKTKSTKDTVHTKAILSATYTKSKIPKSAENRVEISSKGKPKSKKKSSKTFEVEAIEAHDDHIEIETVTSKNKIPSATEQGVHELIDIEDTTFENNKIKSTKDTVNTISTLSATDTKSKIPKSAEYTVEISSKGKPKSKKKSLKTSEVEAIETHDDLTEIETVTTKNKIPSDIEQVHDLIEIDSSKDKTIKYTEETNMAIEVEDKSKLLKTISSKGKPKSKKKSSKTSEVEAIETHDDLTEIETETVTSKHKIPSSSEQGVQDLIELEDTKTFKKSATKSTKVIKAGGKGKSKATSNINESITTNDECLVKSTHIDDEAPKEISLKSVKSVAQSSNVLTLDNDEQSKYDNDISRATAVEPIEIISQVVDIIDLEIENNAVPNETYMTMDTNIGQIASISSNKSGLKRKNPRVKPKSRKNALNEVKNLTSDQTDDIECDENSSTVLNVMKSTNPRQSIKKSFKKTQIDSEGTSRNKIENNKVKTKKKVSQKNVSSGPVTDSKSVTKKLGIPDTEQQKPSNDIQLFSDIQDETTKDGQSDICVLDANNQNNNHMEKASVYKEIDTTHMAVNKSAVDQEDVLVQNSPIEYFVPDNSDTSVHIQADNTASQPPNDISTDNQISGCVLNNVPKEFSSDLLKIEDNSIHIISDQEITTDLANNAIPVLKPKVIVEQVCDLNNSDKTVHSNKFSMKFYQEYDSNKQQDCFDVDIDEIFNQSTQLIIEPTETDITPIAVSVPVKNLEIDGDEVEINNDENCGRVSRAQTTGGNSCTTLHSLFSEDLFNKKSQIESKNDEVASVSSTWSDMSNCFNIKKFVELATAKTKKQLSEVPNDVRCKLNCDDFKPLRKAVCSKKRKYIETTVIPNVHSKYQLECDEEDDLPLGQLVQKMQPQMAGVQNSGEIEYHKDNKDTIEGTLKKPYKPHVAKVKKTSQKNVSKKTTVQENLSYIKTNSDQDLNIEVHDLNVIVKDNEKNNKKNEEDFDSSSCIADCIDEHNSSYEEKAVNEKIEYIMKKGLEITINLDNMDSLFTKKLDSKKREDSDIVNIDEPAKKKVKKDKQRKGRPKKPLGGKQSTFTQISENLSQTNNALLEPRKKRNKNKNTIPSEVLDTTSKRPTKVNVRNFFGHISPIHKITSKSNQIEPSKLSENIINISSQFEPKSCLERNNERSKPEYTIDPFESILNSQDRDNISKTTHKEVAPPVQSMDDIFNTMFDTIRKKQDKSRTNFFKSYKRSSHREQLKKNKIHILQDICIQPNQTEDVDFKKRLDNIIRYAKKGRILMKLMEKEASRMLETSNT